MGLRGDCGPGGARLGAVAPRPCWERSAGSGCSRGAWRGVPGGARGAAYAEAPQSLQRPGAGPPCAPSVCAGRGARLCRGCGWRRPDPPCQRAAGAASAPPTPGRTDGRTDVARRCPGPCPAP